MLLGLVWCPRHEGFSVATASGLLGIIYLVNDEVWRQQGAAAALLQCPGGPGVHAKELQHIRCSAASWG
jgi:hypothetical protein